MGSDGAEHAEAPDDVGPPDPDAVEHEAAADAEEPDVADVAPLSPREQLLTELGHGDDARGLIDSYLLARAYFERGDNRRATAELRALLDEGPSPELAQAAQRMLRRIRPDHVAVAVLVVCAIALAVIWVVAVGAN